MKTYTSTELVVDGDLANGKATQLDGNAAVGDGSTRTTLMGGYTYYPNGYTVLSERQFTKHYYIGSTKIASTVTSIPRGGFVTDNTRQLTGLQSNIQYEAENLAKQGELAPIEWQRSDDDALLEEVRQDEELATKEILKALTDLRASHQDAKSSALETAFETAILQEANVAEFWKEYGDKPSPPVDNSFEKMYWLHSDYLGSNSVLTDNSGNVSNWYEYLPFGEMLMEQSSNSYDNPYKYNGKELDVATGLYYYGARYYDPRTSLFQSVDPLAALTLESYTYALNNPVMYNDPSGLFAEKKGTSGPGDKVNEIEEVIIIKRHSWFYRTFHNIFGSSNNNQGRFRSATINTPRPTTPTLGQITQRYRDYQPSPDDIGGQVVKPLMNVLFDASNTVRNIFGAKDNSGPAGSRFTRWDGMSMGGQEQQNTAFNTLIAAHGLLTAGATSGMSSVMVETSGTVSGSGPVAGVLEVSPQIKSVAQFNNYSPRTGMIEFVYDVENEVFLVGRPKNPTGGLSPHQKLVYSIRNSSENIVGGMFKREGQTILTDEYSGHYGRNWNSQNRIKFKQFMEKTTGQKVIHSNFGN